MELSNKEKSDKVPQTTICQNKTYMEAWIENNQERWYKLKIELDELTDGKPEKKDIAQPKASNETTRWSQMALFS